jgi:hypothetical protein
MLDGTMGLAGCELMCPAMRRPSATVRPMGAIPQAGDLAPGFLAEPGQCWRMVYGSARVGQGTHCTEPVVWRGRFKNAGKGWTVWACEGHTDELEDVRPLRG